MNEESQQSQSQLIMFLNLVRIWQKKWSENPSERTFEQSAMVAMADEVDRMTDLRARLYKAEQAVKDLQYKVDQARIALE